MSTDPRTRRGRRSTPVKGRVALAAASGAAVAGAAVSTVVEPVNGRFAVVGVVLDAATVGAAVDGGVLFAWSSPVVLVVVARRGRAVLLRRRAGRAVVDLLPDAGHVRPVAVGAGIDERVGLVVPAVLDRQRQTPGGPDHPGVRPGCVGSIDIEHPMTVAPRLRTRRIRDDQDGLAEVGVEAQRRLRVRCSPALHAAPAVTMPKPPMIMVMATAATAL